MSLFFNFNQTNRMKFSFIYAYFLLSIGLICFLLFSCEGPPSKSGELNPGIRLSQPVKESSWVSPGNRSLSEEFRSYWYDGRAELNAYQLSQSRYGELREGTAVLIFVTEPFLPLSQVKADRAGEDQVSVLKLNYTKNFLTGIYPYSVMESTFYPVGHKGHAIKSTFSMQEWCGQVYMQLNNRDGFEVRSYSYFENEGDQEYQLDKATLESELWILARISPDELPTGEFDLIPSMEFARLRHQSFKAYKAQGRLEIQAGNYVYTVEYPVLSRRLTIEFGREFPFALYGWEEHYLDGNGRVIPERTTRARLIQRKKLPYWQLNSNSNQVYRDSLGLGD